MSCDRAVAQEQCSEVSTVMADMSQVISDDALIYVRISINIVARFIISIAGIVTNIINMVIFVKLGLKDSMSVGLFSLSLTDVLVTGVQLASCLCFVTGFVCMNIGIDRYLGWAISFVYEISCWITAMISIERCYCVVSPFTVKQVFTRFRCVAATVTIYIVYIGMHVPVYLYPRIKWIETILPSGNKTTGISERSVVRKIVNPELILVELILDLSAGLSLWFVSQAVVIVCAVWMGYSLEVSSRVRRSARKESKDTSERQDAGYSKDSSNLSNRERRLVKVVMVLAITLTCCNVPKMISTTVYYTFPGVHTGDQRNFNVLLWALAYMFGTLGCSASFVVYIQLNTNFRRQFSNILRPSKGKSNTTPVNTASIEK